MNLDDSVSINPRTTITPIKFCLSMSIHELKPNHIHKLQFVEGRISTIFPGYHSITIAIEGYEGTLPFQFKFVIFIIIETPLHLFSEFEDPVDYRQDVKTRYRIGGNIAVIEPSSEYDTIGRSGHQGFKSCGTAANILNAHFHNNLKCSRQLFKMDPELFPIINAAAMDLSAVQIDCRLEAKELAKMNVQKDSPHIQETLKMKAPRPKDYSPGFHALGFLNKLELVSIKQWLERQRKVFDDDDKAMRLRLSESKHLQAKALEYDHLNQFNKAMFC
ncbi:hypothetical protein HDU76_002591 [Blyttiomyces sp. JEL0837]|nr:hypothetical protein HDU76_002591 [Blyttiomyces sp. JEL0837]